MSLADWRSRGEPWELARPVAELKATLRGHGYTVGTLGNDEHLAHIPPEDHTPFSATGWPVPAKRWVVHALDIMPGGALDLGHLAQQLVADRDGGHATWIKYLNCSLPGHPCQHISWEPNKVVVPSSDVGHIHLSIRSDCWDVALNGYDPVARWQAGQTPTPQPQPEAAQAPPWPGVYLRRGITGHGTRTYQQQMSDRGWTITVDDEFGPQTARVTGLFQDQKGLRRDEIVGPQTWRTAWTAPKTAGVEAPEDEPAEVAA